MSLLKISTFDSLESHSVFWPGRISSFLLAVVVLFINSLRLPYSKDLAEKMAPAGEEKRASSKKAKRSGSNVFAMFNQRQVAEFKEGFQVMDVDKDGIISKSDLRACFEAFGRTPNDREIDEMLSEPTGPLNFTMLLQVFGNRLAESGGADDDEAVKNAFNTFDKNGKIDADAFKTALMTFGEKMTAEEIKTTFGQLPMSGNDIDTVKLLDLLLGKGGEDE